MSWIFILLGVIGCMPWASKPVTPPKLSVVSVQSRTIVPAEITAQNTIESSLLQIPNSLLSFSQVTQSAAEVREGPGSQFPIQALFLEPGDRVLILDQYQKWVKIFHGDAGRSGWVHQQALTSTPISTGSFTVDTRSLETLFVQKKHGSQLASYPEQTVLPLAVPVGRMFFVLKKEKKRALVWLPESQSVAWLSSK